jgi:hypothetical protein
MRSAEELFPRSYKASRIIIFVLQVGTGIIGLATMLAVIFHWHL